MSTPADPHDREPPGRLRRKLLWTLAVVGALGALISLSLVSRPTDIVDAPLASDRRGWPAGLAALEETGDENGWVARRLRLQAENSETLRQYDEIRILFGTYQVGSQHVRARVRLLGTGCVYETREEARLLNNQLLSFLRGAGCDAPATNPHHELELVVSSDREGPIAVWTYLVPPDQTSPDQIYAVADVPESGARHAIRGRYVRHREGGGLRRIDLLAYVWQISPATGWIWGLLALAGACAVAAGLLFPLRPLSSPVPPALDVVAGTGGAFFAALALGMIYAVLVPPLQAPDESSHLLSYAQVTGAASVAEDTEAWARLSHFERIRFNPLEHFRPADVGQPFAIGWDREEWAENVLFRSSTTARLWTMIGPSLNDLPTPRILLAIRLINALVFALFVGLSLALLIATSPVPYPQLLMLVVFIVPAVPFFAMHVSETAFLTSASLALAASIAVLCLDGPRAHYAGLPLGLGTALVMTSGRSALPVAAVVATVLLCRLTLGTRDTSERGAARAAAVFWAGLGLGLSVAWAIASETYVQEFSAFDGRPALDTLRASAERIWQRPWLPLLVFAAGFSGELLIHRGRRRWAGTAGVLARAVTPFVSFGAAASLGIVVAASTVLDYPILVDHQGPAQPALRPYVGDVFRTMATSLRFRRLDHFTFSSFWGGFGWLDTMPSPTLLAALGVATAVSLIVLWVLVARARDARRAVWLLGLFAGLAVSLLVYAVAIHAMQRNLHGRYLIPFHLVWLAVAWSAPALVGPLVSPQVVRTLPRPLAALATLPRPAVCLALAGAIHTYCLSFILSRYF